MVKELGCILTIPLWSVTGFGWSEFCQQMLGFKQLTALPGTPAFDFSSSIHLMQNLTFCSQYARTDRHKP